MKIRNDWFQFRKTNHKQDLNGEQGYHSMNIEHAIEAIYTSLELDNEDIDLHISNLKSAMKEHGTTEAIFTVKRLPINNREGRKTMQAYFKKRGVKVSFNSAE